MRFFLLALLAATVLGGCTAIQESFSPHRELLSPCACAEDATAINTHEKGVRA